MAFHMVHSDRIPIDHSYDHSMPKRSNHAQKKKEKRDRFIYFLACTTFTIALVSSQHGAGFRFSVLTSS